MQEEGGVRPASLVLSWKTLERGLAGAVEIWFTGGRRND